MLPIFNVLGKEISAYMITGIIGVLAMFWFVHKEAEKYGVAESELIYTALFGSIGTFLGSHILYAFTVWDKLVLLVNNIEKVKSFEHAVYCIQVVFGGSVYYGGFIGTLIFALIFCKIRKNDYRPIFDVGAVAVPLAHFFGRIGCFLSGCCYGIESKFGFVYKYSLIEECNGVKRLPIQLFESALNLALFFFLWYLLKNRRCKGKLMAVYCLIYPVYRFILEFFRGDTLRGFLGGLSTSQIVSIIVFIVTAVILLIEKNKKSKEMTSKK